MGGCIRANLIEQRDAKRSKQLTKHIAYFCVKNVKLPCGYVLKRMVEDVR